MDRIKLTALALTVVMLSTALIGVGYSAFHATYESSNNTITVGSVTAISLGTASSNNITDAGNGSFTCDLTLKSLTTQGGTTYTFNSTSANTAPILDAYVIQKIGTSSASGKLTVTITTTGINWSNVQQAGVTAKAGETSANTLTLANGSITAIWNSVTIPAHANSPTLSNGLHLKIEISSAQMSNITFQSATCSNVTVTALFE